MTATKPDYVKAKIAILKGILTDNNFKNIEFINKNHELKEIRIILK